MSVKVREKKGSWWLFIDHKGHRKAKKIKGNKRDANRLAKQLQANLDAGDLGFLDGEEAAKTLNYYIELWLHGSARVTLRDSTLTGYRGLYRKHIKKTKLGKTPVDKITELNMESFLLKKLDNLSNSSVTHIRNCASGGFKTAKKDKAITQNPCHGFTIGTKEDLSRKPKLEPLNSEELTVLLKTFSIHRGEHYALIMVLGFAGLRIGEAVGLKWSDIHFEDRYIHVQRAYSHDTWGNVKNGKDRKVDLSRLLATVLKERKLAAKPGQELIFPNREGRNPINASNFRKRVFYPMLKEAGLRRVRVHDLRHTFASLLIDQTKNLHYVKEQLGHSSIKVTSDIYGHLLKPTGEKRQIDILDTTFKALADVHQTASGS